MNHQLQPDEFECAVQVRAAHDRIIGEAYVITEILDLDPACVEGMQVACRRDDATTAMREATISSRRVCALITARRGMGDRQPHAPPLCEGQSEGPESRSVRAPVL